MTEDVQVRFGGDVSGIQAASQQAQQATRSFAQQTRAQTTVSREGYADLAAQIRDTNDALRAIQASSEDTAAIAAQARAVAVLVAAYAGLSAASDSAGRTIGALATGAVDAVRAQIAGASAAVDGFAGTAAVAAAATRGYFTEVAYAERGTRLFEQANDGARAAIGRQILAVEQLVERLRLSGTEIARTQFEAIAAAGGLDRFREALNGAGAKGFLVDTTAELMKIPGLSQEAAAGIEVMFTAIPDYSTRANAMLVTLLQSMSRTGDEAVANAKRITDAFKDSEAGGQTFGAILVDNLKNLDDLQIAASNLARQMQPQQAAAMFDTIIRRLRDQEKIQQAITEENDKSLRAYPLIGNALAAIYEWQTRSAEKQRELSGAVQVTTAAVEQQRGAFQAAADAQQRQIDLEKLLGVETTRAGRQSAAEGDIATLTRRSRRDDPGLRASERDLMIRTVYGEAGGEGEVGQEAVANVIRNRLLSGYRDARSYDDVITAPRQFSVWNAGDPAGDRAMALDPDSAVYKRLGELVDRVAAGESADPTGGATSYYNPKVASPTWGADMSNRTNLGNHVFGNTPESPPVVSDEQQAAINERLAQRRDTLRQIADEARGGTQTDLASLDIAEKAVATARDQVEEARRLVEARQKDLDATRGGSEGAAIGARRALAEAQQALRQRETEQDRAATQLQVANMEAASGERLRILNDELAKEQDAYRRGSAEWNRLETQKAANTRQYEQAVAQQRASAANLETARMETASAERLRILNEALTQEQALHERGSTQWNRLEAQKVANARSYEQAIAQERATAEDTAYQAARRVLDDRLRDIRQEAQERGLSFAERRTETAAVLTQIEELERAHQQRLATIWGQGTSQHRQAQAQLERQAAESASRRAQSEREMRKAEFQDTKRAYEQIGSTVTSSAFSVIQGQQTVAQAARNTALSIVQSYVQAKVRLVADWLAGVATHQAGEATKTAATVAGVTARGGAEEAGAAASLATQAGVMVKSIMASAAETFAGIFGFLSPLMGPAAVGPAVAGQATVAAAAAAIPSFAVGTWNLPSDTLAQVHRGEMIVPATATPWAQALMANAAGGGASGPAGGGGSVTFNVSAVDAAGVQRFFRSNARHIMGAINEGVRTGSHLGLRNLGKPIGA